MWHRHAGASGRSETVGLAVRDLWEVAADPSYDVHCRALGRQVVAVRTLSGEGLLECDHFQAKIGRASCRERVCHRV